MRRPLSRIAWLALALLGCSEGPAYATLGAEESYCATHADCDPGLFCVRVDEASFCTLACTSGLDCPESYACSRTEGICRPESGGMCRGADRRCGPSFAPCCEGLVCATFPPFGAYCTSSCTNDAHCSSGCCASTGTARICAPPSFC